MDETRARDEVSEEIGRLEWHCSEEDGLPDVGVSLAIAPGIELWCGEVPRARWDTASEDVQGIGNDGGWWLAIYKSDEVVLVGKVGQHEGRALLEDELAPALRAAIQSAASMEREAAREGIIAALDRRIRGDGSTYNEGFDNAMRAAISIVRHHLPPEQANG